MPRADHPGLGHWDDLEPETIATRELGGRRTRIASALGASRLGLSRYEMGPGDRAMPVHVHGDEEELFVILSGSGVSVEGDSAYAVEAGDAVFYPADGTPHTVVAGQDGLDLLAFASGSDSQISWLPRAGAMWVGPHWIPLEGESPFSLEDDAGPLDVPAVAPRPSTIVGLADLEPVGYRSGEVGRLTRRAGTALGARRSGLAEIRVEPGRLSSAPHCHSADEEIFVVTGGDGSLELLGDEGPAVSYPLRRGRVACRPPGSGVAHAFRAGEGGLTLLAFSTSEPSDICFYPRSGTLRIPGLGATLRVEPIDDAEG